MAGPLAWSHSGHAQQEQKLNATARKKAQRVDVLQMLSTVLGALVLFFLLLGVAITWYYGYTKTRDSLNSTAAEFRLAQVETLKHEIAIIIRPAWTIAREFVDRLKVGGEQDGYAVAPPRWETFRDPAQLEAYARLLIPYVNWEVHLRSVNEDFTSSQHNMFVGAVMVLALDENYEPATSLDTCRKGIFCGTILHPETQRDFFLECLFLDPANGSLATGDAALAEDFESQFSRYTRQIRSDYTISGPVGESPATMPCAKSMGPLWGGQPRLADFYNFSWFGPIDPGIGWGNHLEGSVPIYDDEGRQQIGRFGTVISMGMSISPLLREMIRSSRVTRGGVSALYTAGGMILGLSEEAASSSDGEEQAVLLEDVAYDSHTAAALRELMARYGTTCPSSGKSFEFDGRVVDVAPFVATEHGLPPLPESWCILMSLPRQNYYQPIDDAEMRALIVGVICLVGFSGGLLLLGTSLALAIRAQSKMKREKREVDWAVVREAEESMTRLMSPMVLVRAEDFLELHHLECYEDWRDRGKVTTLDNINAVEGFKAAGNLILFISHQWLGYKYPDTGDNVQLKVMHRVARHFLTSNEGAGKGIYIWLDYISIAQRHTGCQVMAVSSLPVYVSLVDYFVICAPDALHKDSHLPVGLESYSRRGWCRTEMLAKACGSGIQNMYVCAGPTGEMRPFTKEDTKTISLNVYEGDFTVPTDAEKLVVPVLGLYSLILRHDNQEMKSIRDFILARKETFFPHSYSVMVDGEMEERKLFGNLVRLMEEHVFFRLAKYPSDDPYRSDTFSLQRGRHAVAQPPPPGQD